MATSMDQASRAGVQPLKISKGTKSKVSAPKLVKHEEMPKKMIPSEFARNMSKSTDEWLANTCEMHPPRILELLDMSESTHQKFSSVDVDQALFQPFPSEVVFQNYAPSETYELPLKLHNMDKFPRLVKVEEEDSLVFRVVSPEDVCNKVAPGLASMFTVIFTPQENKDYRHRLVFVTERERFEVPVRAVGARAILDFPDKLHFTVCPVRTSAQRVLLVRNIGNIDAKFQLRTHSPFSVAPAVGTVAVGESMQVTVDFLPKTAGDHWQDLELHYHSGEDVYISLYGASADVNVRLDRRSMMMMKTYVSLSSQRSLAIHNRSDTLLHFQWKNFATEEEEEEHMLRECADMQQKEDDMQSFLSVCNADAAVRDRLTLLTRTFQDRRRQARRNRLALARSYITVDPPEGEIWPNSSVDVNIIFKPQEAVSYQDTFYCDISGRESRLPLQIKGEGLGPKLQLNYDLLDIGDIFMGSKRSYEVLLKNEGLTAAPYRLECPSSAFGHSFSFSPTEGMVPPSACHAVEVCFSSCTLGTFSEDFLFTVVGNPQPLTVTIRGRVLGPTFHFDVPELNFGDVSFGFPHTLTCTLSNTSLVPMTFALRVPGDGSGDPSVSSATQVAELGRTDWQCSSAASRPAEFSLRPSSGTVRALAERTIQVTLCSNRVQSYRLALVVDVEGVGEEVLALPITASCVVPEVVVETPELQFHRCFLGYPYEQVVKLTNHSDLPACYGLVSQEDEEQPTVLYSSQQPRGVLGAGSSVGVPLVLLAKTVGRLQHTAHIAVFGQRQAPLEVLLSCTGEGPVVDVRTMGLDFGSIPVLTDVCRTLQLSNQSPIPACFTAEMGHSRSRWRVEPSEGAVPAQGRLELRLVAHLDDTVQFQDRLQLSIQDSRTHRIPLVAKGTGTTIVSSRPFAPSLDLGAHFSSGPCQYRLTLTNRGRRSHQLYWTTEGFPVFPRRDSREVRGPGPVFSVRPPRMELAPGDSADIVLEGSSDCPKVVRERLVCHAILGHQSGKERIMTVDVTSSFVAPVLHFSSQQLNFYLEKAPGVCLEPQYQKLVMRNMTSLDLCLDLSLAPPFVLWERWDDPAPATSKSLVLGVGVQADVWVWFDPSYRQDHVTRVAEEVLQVRYRDHPQQDAVRLRGEVHFPNLHFSCTSLDFGCVLNHTESQRQLTMTNCSPLPVAYRWVFLVDQQRYAIRFPSSPKEPPSALPLTPTSTPPAQLIASTTINSVGVEQVFDILPMYGSLHPGQSQQVTFSFYGHAHITGEVLALCEVEEGPTYEVTIRGEASLVTYSLDTKHIHFGRQLFDRVSEAEMTLRNSGKVGFQFSALLEGQGDPQPEDPQPGQPRVTPPTGYIEAEAEQKLRVSYLPGVPEVFHQTFQLQVAFFSPETVAVSGEGVFPRLCLDLPRHTINEDRYAEVVNQAKASLEEDGERGEGLSRPASGEGQLFEEDCTPTYDGLLQMEIDRLLVKENAVAMEKSRKKLCRFLLPEYVLDFGFVIHGNVPTHIVKVTNTVPVAASFRADRRPLTGTGFSTELDRVKNLPYCETETFEVKFDPRGANLDLGEISTVMPIQVVAGPTVQVLLRAVVTMPALVVSTDTLQFDCVQCGMCQVRTVQLFNQEPVACQWSIAEDERPKKKIDKHVPMHLRRKARQEQRPPPVVFEMLPSAGLLHPGDKVNVQVKFSPVEGRVYSQRLVVSVAQSSQRVVLQAQGQGEEPQLEWSSSVLELGPALPLSAGEEAEVTVRNPCPFPIEFYSLEFDKQYLEEEKILRVMKGYDDQNILLLPPRAPGDTLPPELLQYYKEHYSDQPDAAGSPEAGQKGEGPEEDLAIALPTDQHLEEEREESKAAPPSKDERQSAELQREQEDSRGGSDSGVGVGQLEVNPVSRAIARHMGIDLSPEGQAARNRRGIAIIVHGAPLSGKTSTAVALARHYGGACLSLDTVVLEAMSSGATPSGLQARDLCARAAMEHAQKKTEEAAQAVVDVTGAGTAAGGAGLSVEAVAKHTAEGSQTSELKAPPSSVSTRNKTSVVGGGKRADGSQPTTIPSLHQLIVSELLIGQVGELCLMSCQLPEQLLADILAERLQLSDCHRGVVIDGLETLYSRSVSRTLQVVLKAFNHRQHIYLVNLQNTYDAFKATERAQRDAEEALQREQADKEKLRLQEMDEEEYDALPEEERERIDLRHLEQLRERKRRKQERAERERREKMQQEETERLREEEEMKRKNKKGKKEPPKDDPSGKKSQLGGKQASHASVIALRSDTKLDQPPKDGRKSSCTDWKESKDSPTEGSREAEDTPKKKKPKEGKAGGQEESPLPTDDPEREPSGEVDRLLLARFRLYEQSQSQLLHVLQHWDRAQGLLLLPLPQEDTPPETDDPGPAETQAPSGKKSKKEREKEKVDKERERQEREKQRAGSAEVKPASPALSQAPLPGDVGDGGDREAPPPPEVVPHMVLSVSGREQPSTAQLLNSLQLPGLEEVLEGLGLGPSGPPLPASTIFSVVPYPKRRGGPNAAPPCPCFTFLVPSTPDDTNYPDKKDPDLDGDTQASLLSKVSFLEDEDQATPTKRRGRKAESGRESQRDKRRTPAKTGGRAAESRSSPPLNAATPLSDTDQGSRAGDAQQERCRRLTTFRWIVPANEEVTLNIRFHSNVPGQFDQTLNFELLATRRRYQVHCRGVCAFPSISRDIKTVFAHSKRVSQPEEGLKKTYIVRSRLYEFGPLLCGKTRDRYKEKKYPENMERLVIQNSSPLEAEIHFCFQNDIKATTYLLDPPTMTLQPNDKQELRVWAYPTSQGQVEDSLVCLVKDNPDPVTFRFSCRGVRPELEVERKQLHFDKILLHRKETRSLLLRNNTLLPVAWRLSGLEALGDEFSVCQDQGIIPPHSDFCLQMHFRAMKPISLKRAVRLEVSDVENILGIVHTENIQVLAEAYDVSLDITFPKGALGFLDFGTIKVSEEVKLSVNMKNKGKYQIAFKFMLESTDPSHQDLSQMFTITPQQGSLPPTDKSTGVQFVFRHDKEVSIREQTVLHCQVIEPNLGEGGETIGNIPIKVSVQSLFSKYSVLPASDINFGPLLYGCRTTRTFSIQNQGDLEIRFSISGMSKDPPVSAQRRGTVAKRTSSYKVRRTESIQKDVGMSTQARITVGVFSVSPCFGVLAPGGQQVVTVDCVAEQAGCWQEGLSIDITHRDPAQHPGGVPYRLAAEVCHPGITTNVASIFEEHRLCPSAGQLLAEQYRQMDCIYILDQNKFVFNNVLLGRPAEARFRLTNAGKVPCDLSLAIKSTKPSLRGAEVFEVTPPRMSIPSQSHAFAVVTFAPQTTQTYQAVFEASLEGASSLAPTGRPKVLVFDLTGEANLPSVEVLRPLLRLMRFKRLLVGRTHTLPLLLRNDGNVPAQVHIKLLDEKGVFTLRAAPKNNCVTAPSADTECQLAHSAPFRLGVGQQAEFQVVFCPLEPVPAEASVCLQVDDNPYGDVLIRLLGEGYHNDVVLDNISSPATQEEVAANGGCELLRFGNCHVGRSYQQSVTMSNLSSAHALRFHWSSETPQLSVSPRVGHLHAGCSKDITFTLCSQQPLQLSGQPMRCRLSRVEFQEPVDQVADWDDRLVTVRWLDAGKQQPAKKKVVETDPEPCCSVVDDSHQEVELRVDAVCDYASFTCSTQPIHFRDTLLYQTRLVQLDMVNQGSVQLEFSWQVFMDRSGQTAGFYHHRGVTPGSALRPASSLGSVCSLMLGNPELPPFSVEPAVGSIDPGATHTFLIRFSPLEVAQYEARLVCSIPNLKDEPAPTVTVSGRGLLPYCHFHLKDSDYISRRNPDLRGPHGAPPRAPLHPDTRVLEVCSVGIGARIPRQFSVVNPTHKAYSFLWKCEDSGPSPFSCLTPKMSIQPGKKVEVVFEFVAEELEITESFWTFLIPELSLSVPFLLVGTATEPQVYLDRVHLNLGPLLLGRQVEQTVYLVNGEEQPFTFSVPETSGGSEAFQDGLLLRPMKGTIRPKHRLPVVVSFTPSQEGPVAFNLAVRVRGKVEPLCLNVKAEGYSMAARVLYHSPEGGGVTELAPSHTHLVHFNKVELSHKSSCTFLVSNPGRFTLDVEFDLWGRPDLQRQLRVEPERASVEVGGQIECSLTFFPKQRCVLKDMGLSIKVKNGAVFRCSLAGSAVPPGLEFSFLKHDFGMSLLHCPGMVPLCHTLTISNKGQRGISLECPFENTPYLEVGFKPQVLPPGGSMEVPITFYPREARHYHDKLLFNINDRTKQVVEILGQGVEMKVELEDPGQRQVNLGALQVGQKSRTLVPLLNNSPSALTFSLRLNTSTHTLLDSKVLCVSPAAEVTLKPGGGRCVAELLFSPRQRMAPFRAELQAECVGVLRPLVELTGCCQGVEVSLDQDYLPFGAVVQHCRATRRIMMSNTGDIGARYQWDVQRFAPDFSISPAEGYICPGMEVIFQVTFSPVELSQDRRYDHLACSIQGAAPLTLTLTGSCITTPVYKEAVSFACQVRSQNTQSLRLSNQTSQRWTLQPVLQGEHWAGPAFFIIDPHQQNKAYDITYKPMVMSADGNKHQGSVLFSFPDGTGMLYTLQGMAEPPQATATITHQFPCKTRYTEQLPVENWLAKSQRFRVLVEMIRPERPDNTVTLKGLDYIDVPALATRGYKITFFTYKEGQYNAKVTFRNETSGEYLFYVLNFKATPPGVTSTITMTTPVRQTASASIKVENPLPLGLNFTAECRCPDVSVPPQLSVPALSKGTLSFEYQPLREGESTARLVLQNGELGCFQYELLLCALPAPREKPLYFRTALGSGHALSARFTNYSRVKAEYSCKTDCPEFTTEKSIHVAAGCQAGMDASVEVYFEPCQLGEVRGTLTLDSAFGGEYVFPLLGTCTPPKAQGPFTIRTGCNISIPFKNIFLETTAFSFQVDNPAFTVKGVETIRSKKTHNVLVTFEGPPLGSPGPCCGKLSISSPRSEGISWLFYLKGCSPESREKTS